MAQWWKKNNDRSGSEQDAVVSSSGGASEEGSGAKSSTSGQRRRNAKATIRLPDFLHSCPSVLKRALELFNDGKTGFLALLRDVFNGPVELAHECGVFNSFPGFCLVLFELLKVVVEREKDLYSASGQVGCIFRFLLSVARLESNQIAWDPWENKWRKRASDEALDIATVKLLVRAHLLGADPRVDFLGLI